MQIVSLAAGSFRIKREKKRILPPSRGSTGRILTRKRETLQYSAKRAASQCAERGSASKRTEKSRLTAGPAAAQKTSSLGDKFRFESGTAQSPNGKMVRDSTVQLQRRKAKKCPASCKVAEVHNKTVCHHVNMSKQGISSKRSAVGCKRNRVKGTGRHAAQGQWSSRGRSVENAGAAPSPFPFLPKGR